MYVIFTGPETERIVPTGMFRATLCARGVPTEVPDAIGERLVEQRYWEAVPEEEAAEEAAPEEPGRPLQSDDPIWDTLFAAFPGESLDEILERSDGALLAVPGIGPVTLNKIRASS